MTMPSGNVVLSDKMQYPSGGGGGAVAGGEIHQNPRQWFPDERDGFISWLRGEFAAANAIIDSLCHHLRAVGEPSEYDMVIGCIQQRRCNWTPVLHMQQYFSVAEVIYALQQVAWRRQQRYYDPVKMGNKEYKRSGVGFKPGQQRSEPVKEWHNASVEYRSYDGNALEKVGSEEVKPGGEAGKVDDKGSAPSAEKKGTFWVYDWRRDAHICLFTICLFDGNAIKKIELNKNRNPFLLMLGTFSSLPGQEFF